MLSLAKCTLFILPGEHCQIWQKRSTVLCFHTTWDQGLSTVWDDHLSYLLTPALAAYETERVTGWFEKKSFIFLV